MRELRARPETCRITRGGRSQSRSSCRRFARLPRHSRGRSLDTHARVSLGRTRDRCLRKKLPPPRTRPPRCAARRRSPKLACRFDARRSSSGCREIPPGACPSDPSTSPPSRHLPAAGGAPRRGGGSRRGRPRRPGGGPRARGGPVRVRQAQGRARASVPRRDRRPGPAQGPPRARQAAPGGPLRIPRRLHQEEQTGVRRIWEGGRLLGIPIERRKTRTREGERASRRGEDMIQARHGR